MRLDLGHDGGARAIAALRDNNLNVDPNDPSTDGCDSSLALEESEGSDLSNSWDSSNVDPDDPYDGGCGSSLGSEEVDAAPGTGHSAMGTSDKSFKGWREGEPVRGLEHGTTPGQHTQLLHAMGSTP